MGATILGDGCVAPIVDVGGIAAMNLFSLQDAVKKVKQSVPPSQSDMVA
jgi:chemotaxis protein histidine kinase CheA